MTLLWKTEFFTNIIVYFNRTRKCSVKKKVTLKIFVVCTVIVMCVCVCAGKILTNHTSKPSCWNARFTKTGMIVLQCSLHKKWSFSLTIFSVFSVMWESPHETENLVTHTTEIFKEKLIFFSNSDWFIIAGNSKFGHIYWRNP